jgi:hypothetical protein
MRTNTQEGVLSAYIASIGKRTPRDAAQDATELCRLATSLSRLRVSGFVLTNPESKKTRSPATSASPSSKTGRKQNLQTRIKAVLERAGGWPRLASLGRLPLRLCISGEASALNC